MQHPLVKLNDTFTRFIELKDICNKIVYGGEDINNYSQEDIESLTNEIMETAGNYAKRKGVVFG